MANVKIFITSAIVATREKLQFTKMKFSFDHPLRELFLVINRKHVLYNISGLKNSF